MKKVYASLVILFVTLGFILASSAYAAYLGKSEMLHFWVFFSGKGGRPPSSIEIDVNRQGVLKRLLNPWVVALSTHWIINIDNKPHSIRLELVNCTFPVEWEVSAGIPWDSSTKSFRQPVGPGQSIPYLGLDWVFHIPPEVRSQKVWYEGGLAVIDTDSNKTLSFVPIAIYGGWGLGG